MSVFVLLLGLLRGCLPGYSCRRVSVGWTPWTWDGSIPSHGSNTIATDLSLLEDLIGLVPCNVKYRHVLTFNLVAGVSSVRVIKADRRAPTLAMAVSSSSSSRDSTQIPNIVPEPITGNRTLPSAGIGSNSNGTCDLSSCRCHDCVDLR